MNDIAVTSHFQIGEKNLEVCLRLFSYQMVFFKILYFIFAGKFEAGFYNINPPFHALWSYLKLEYDDSEQNQVLDL